MIIPTVVSLLVITLLIFIYFEGKREEEEKRKNKKEKKDYAASIVAINNELFDLEEKCREWERKERQIEDLRTEAMTRQKRRARHKNNKKIVHKYQ